MMKHKTTRYCAPPDVVRLLQRDGIGWGHDLQCGQMNIARATQKKEVR